MSAVTIVKNIFEFAKILSNASRDDVCRWSKKSIQNALSWADYCQEIYKCVKDQDYEEDINQQLYQMTLFLEPVSCLRLSVESLGKAKILLTEALLLNPKFPVASKCILQDMMQENAESARVLHEFDNSSSQLKLYSKVCQETLNQLNTTPGCKDRIDQLDQVKVKYEARLLAQHLTFTLCKAKKIDRFTKYCQALFDKLGETLEGWGIIVIMLCEIQDLRQEELNSLSQVQAHILNWLRMNVILDVSTSKLWLLNVDFLSQASCDNEEFFHLYLNLLVLWADTFTPVIDRGSKFIWRSSSGHNSDILTAHFKQMLEILTPLYEERRKKALETIVFKVKSTDFTVWQVLAQTMLQSMMKI